MRRRQRTVSPYLLAAIDIALVATGLAAVLVIARSVAFFTGWTP